MSANGYDGGTKSEKNIRALSIFWIFLKNENLWSLLLSNQLAAAIICTNHTLIKKYIKFNTDNSLLPNNSLKMGSNEQTEMILVAREF